MTVLELHKQIELIQEQDPGNISVTAQKFPEDDFRFGFLIAADVTGMDSAANDDLFNRMQQVAILLRENVSSRWIVRIQQNYSNGFCRVDY